SDELKKMDSLWVNNSGGNFGFSVQKRIWVRTGNRLGVKIEDWNEEDRKNYIRFASSVGRYDENSKNNERESGWMNYHDYMDRVETVDPSMDPSMGGFRGGLPLVSSYPLGIFEEFFSRAFNGGSFLALRLVYCNI
ncbi:MAG: GUN4 domain-containing protein, partial [Rivularia sp. (in: cyanobacteria)]